MAYKNTMLKTPVSKSRLRSTRRKAGSTTKGRVKVRTSECVSGACPVTWKPKPTAA